MDRREALKKLAAGGVVAAGAPIVLSSFDVAAAASPPDTGLQGVPGSGEPILVNHQITASDTVALSIATAPTCSSGTLTTTYEWMIIGYTVQAQRRLQIRNSTNTSTLVNGTVDTTCSGGCGTPSYSTPSTATGAVVLRSVQQGNDAMPRALAAGNLWSVQVRITWQCSGHSALQAEYRMDATYPNPPTVTNQSYTIL